MDCLALRRRGEHVVLRFRCMVSISNLLGPTEKTDRRAEDLDGASLLPALQYNPAILKTSKERAVAAAEVEGLDSVAALREYVLRTTTAPAEDTALTALLAHKLMLRALELSCAQEAVRVFENLFGFRSNRTTVGSPVLAANVIVCATAVKAYGRLGDCDRALQVWRWLEGPLCQAADIYLLSAVLHVCAKMRRADIAERIFHQEIPARGLNYTTATANSMLYLYATLRRPQEALNMYQFMINQSLPCNDATYGTLIKVRAD
jgi:pentatricopeptide repeat protein